MAEINWDDAGWNPDTKVMTYFDPRGDGTMRRKDMSDWSFAEIQEFKDDKGLGYYEYESGEQVYGRRPEVTYQEPTQGIVRPGTEPWTPQVDTGDLTLGYGDETANTGNTPAPAPGQPIAGDPATDPFAPGYSGPPAWTLGNGGGGQTPARDGTWDFTGGPQQGAGGGYEYYDAGNRPGEQSPWGTPAGGPGGNQEFYQRQIANLMNQQDAYQTAASTARDVAAQPKEANDPFSWSEVANYQGPEAWFNREGVAGGGGNQFQGDPLSDAGYYFNSAYDLGHGSTNADIISQMGGIWDAKENDQWQNWMQENKDFGGSRFIASHDDPNSFMEAWRSNNPGAQGQWVDNYQKLANNLWSQPSSTGPSSAGVPS